MKTLVKAWLLVMALLTWIPQMVSAQDLFPEQNKKGRWGYVDLSGRKVIDYKYDEAQNFVDGVAMVRKGDSWGLINVRDDEVLKVKYDLIEKHSDKVYRVAQGGKHKDGVLMDEKYGFMSDKGKTILKPEYDEIGSFVNGMAFIKKGNTYGYINEAIEVVIPCKFNAVGSYNKQGYVWVCSGAKYAKNGNTIVSGKFGIYDAKGLAIIPVKYARVGTFNVYESTPSESQLKNLSPVHKTVLLESGSHFLYSKYYPTLSNFSQLSEDAVGFYYSNKNDGTKNAVVSLSGNVLIKEGKYQSAFYPTDGLALVMETKSKKYNFLDLKSGKMLLKQSVTDAWAFESGISVVENNGKMWMIDTSGNPKSAEYDHIFPSKEGLRIVLVKAGATELYGAIDANGKEAITPMNPVLLPPVDGVMVCVKTGNPKLGYINTSGDWVIQPSFDYAESFKQGMASVQKDKKWGVIDTTGKEIVKCRWTGMIAHENDMNGYIWVSDDTAEEKSFMLLKVSSDQLVTKDRYKWVHNVGQDFEGIAFAGDDQDHIGVITAQGKLIVPKEFNWTQANTSYKYYLSKGEGSAWEAFDTYRVKLYSNPQRNQGKLSEVLGSSMWDY